MTHVSHPWQQCYRRHCSDSDGSSAALLYVPRRGTLSGMGERTRFWNTDSDVMNRNHWQRAVLRVACYFLVRRKAWGVLAFRVQSAAFSPSLAPTINWRNNFRVQDYTTRQMKSVRSRSHHRVSLHPRPASLEHAL